jgi:hypothetical protein
VGAHGAAALLAGAAGRLMADQLIDDPGGDAGVFQPGREGVPKVVGAVQIHGLQQRVTGRGQRPPTLLAVLAGAGDQVGGDQLGEGDLDGGWPNGPALGGERGGELVGGLPAASSEGREHAVGRSSPVGSASLASAV